jgi:hypothetical protein
LTSLIPSKVKFEWHSSHQQAFDKNEKGIATEIQVLLCYADFNRFDSNYAFTETSEHELGAVIKQDRSL